MANEETSGSKSTPMERDQTAEEEAEEMAAASEFQAHLFPHTLPSSTVEGSSSVAPSAAAAPATEASATFTQGQLNAMIASTVETTSKGKNVESGVRGPSLPGRPAHEKFGVLMTGGLPLTGSLRARPG